MNTVDPLYKRDPEAYRAALAEGNRRQARKRVGADALILDNHGRILLVDPNYKPDWDLPGGMAEANEPPDDALRRELAEELNLHITTPLRLLCVDWISPHNVWDDALMFIFDGGFLSGTDQLTIGDDELDAFEFCSPAVAEKRLRPYVWNRVHASLRARIDGTTAYLRDGRC